ncbi:MAG TPA: tetratricopeptide repeat protein [Thermoanaerobaculia bacterium]|nr:tetratricopeptide repeat protein [Thermoanaerobaculia bacterium]
MPADERTVAPAVPLWLLVLALALVTFLAYRPAWHGGKLWDDAAHVTRPELQSLDGLGRIWLELGATQQYYPLTHTAFWIQHRLWGDDTFGYHLVNISLHLATALLLFAILRTLQVKGAFLASAVFALHPVHVESVAWITELKNTLAGVLFAAAVLAWLRFDTTRRKRAYVAALALFVLGLMAKTVVAVLPAGLLVILWWRHGRLEWRRDVAPLAPFFALGLGAGLLTAWVEKHFIIGALAIQFGLDPLERVLLAGRAFWFYLGKLLWPAELIFFYPRWDFSRVEWWAFLFPVGAVGLAIGAWELRKRWRGPLAALLFFVIALLPALGFVDIYPFRFSFVADHFQYLASLGVIVFACAAAATWWEPQTGWRRPAGLAVGLIVLATFAGLTWRQSRLYASAETLYRGTLERNPGSWLALNNLGVIRLERHDDTEAERLFFESLRLNPGYEAALNNCGFVLARRGQVDEAIGYYRRALQVWPDYPDAHVNLGNAQFVTGQLDEAIRHYERALRLRPGLLEPRNNLAFALVALGRPREALPHFEAALKLHGSSRTVLLGLARTLAVSRSAHIRDGPRAVDLAERAAQLTGHRDPQVLDVLAAAYAETGRFGDAVSTAAAALDLARGAGLTPLAGEIEGHLGLYRSERPFHESGP